MPSPRNRSRRPFSAPRWGRGQPFRAASFLVSTPHPVRSLSALGAQVPAETQQPWAPPGRGGTRSSPLWRSSDLDSGRSVLPLRDCGGHLQAGASRTWPPGAGHTGTHLSDDVLPPPPLALCSPSKGTWKRTSLTHLLSWAPIMLLALPAPLPQLETSGQLRHFHPLEYSGTKLGLTQRTLPSRSAQQGGKWAGRSVSRHSTKQYFHERHGLVPLPSRPGEEVLHFTRLRHSYRSGPLASADGH